MHFINIIVDLMKPNSENKKRMENNLQEKINKQLEIGFKVSASSIIDKAFEIFKGIAGFAILAVIIYIVASWIINSLLGIIFPMQIDEEEIQAIANSGDIVQIQEYYKDIFASSNFALSSTISTLLSSALYPILYSVFVMARKFDLHQNIEFSDIFVHYKNGKFLNLFLVTLIVQIVGSIGFMLCIIPGFIVSTMWMLAVPLIIFGSADIKDALNYSMKLAFKSFGGFFTVLLMCIGVIIVGLLLCCIGIIAAIPLVYIIIYVLYKDVIGFSDDNSDEISQLGTDIYKDNPYMK
ncbi:hypothetical protein [Algoriella sp.]|uniref:hypothetical protein n=1 Tax=Algoriella sp. TaxID=1872434 RepID=UPI002FC6F451